MYIYANNINYSEQNGICKMIRIHDRVTNIKWFNISWTNEWSMKIIMFQDTYDGEQGFYYLLYKVHSRNGTGITM